MCPCHVLSCQIHSVFVISTSCVPERRKIIHEMHPTRRKNRLIDRSELVLFYYSLCVISVVVIVAVVEQCILKFILVFFVLK